MKTKKEKTWVDKQIKDLTFGIKPVAWSIYGLLDNFYMQDLPAEEAEILEDMLQIKTAPFYNGREASLCITFGSWLGDTQRIFVFGENRNSDNIFIDCWDAKTFGNIPTVKDFTEEAYQNRKYLSYNEIYEAAEYIKQKMAEFIPVIIKEYKKRKK